LCAVSGRARAARCIGGLPLTRGELLAERREEAGDLD
jgi:hypothetical protein